MKDIEIIYEDRWLVVVEKPCGMLSMSTGKGPEMTAYSILRETVGRVFIVHRLDRDTSGLLVFAKDEETKFALQDHWDKAVLERKYTAILEGKIDSEEGYIETWLCENPKSMKVHAYEMRLGDDPAIPPRRDWKYASSHCRRLRTGMLDGKEYTLVEFALETGRKNQIRVHSQWIGHPIAGDRKYGAHTDPLGRLALHAHALTLIHPHTSRPLRFTSRLPKPFTRLKQG